MRARHALAGTRVAFSWPVGQASRRGASEATEMASKFDVVTVHESGSLLLAIRFGPAENLSQHDDVAIRIADGN